jgi:hypothetical protein
MQEMLKGLEGDADQQELDMNDRLLDHFIVIIRRETDVFEKLVKTLQELLGQPEDTRLPALAQMVEDRNRRYLEVPVVSRKRKCLEAPVVPRKRRRLNRG